MYDAIYNFAIKKQLVPIEYFTYKLISAYVLLNEKSEYLGFEVKDKKDTEKTLCPDIGTVSQGRVSCNPIVEKTSFIFDKNKTKHTGFIQIMNLGAMENKNMKIVYDFIEKYENDINLEERIMEDMKNQSLGEKDLISFKIDNLKLEEDESWKSWFLSYMQDKKVISSITTISAITGKKVIPIINDSPKIKNPSSILGKGQYVIPIAKKKDKGTAFKSYGLQDKRNSPIGENEANIIKKGLEYLLSNKEHFNNDFGIIHFCDDDSNNVILNNLLNKTKNPIKDFYESENLEDIKINKNSDLILENTLDSMKTGKSVNTQIQNDIFHIMKIDLPPVKESGRFYLSYYKKGSCKELQKNILIWIEDSKIKNEICTNSINNIYSIFECLLQNKNAENKYEQIKKEFGEDKINLLYAIIDNTQIPIRIFKRAILIFRNNIVTKHNMNIICVQIIKIYLNRNQRKKGETEFMESLNPNEENVAYNCGRLFALYEIIQSNAQGNLNSSVTDNFFASAQQTPAMVFGRLATLCNYHLRKLDESKRIYWNKKLQEIGSKISSFPKTLNFEEQGIFTLGYYHQKNDNFKSKKNNNDNNKGEENNEE